MPRLLERLSVPRKGLIGPWVHSYPHTATPEPAIGFLQECLRWWDCWLKDVDTGIMDEPMLRVWMPEAVPPQPFEPEWPGRWVAEPGWPPAQNAEGTYFLTEEHLEDEAGPARQVTLVGEQTNGSTAGVWCPYGNKFGMPIDQRIDDGLSLCFTSAPMEEPVEILGFPKAELQLSVDQPRALVAVRLCDVASDGESRLVSWGLLNLTHREGHADPQPLEPGRNYTVTVQLNVAAHRLDRGHRWRLAISPTYWPHAWPSPVPVRLTLHTGSASRLLLPIRPAGALDGSLAAFGEAEGASMLQHDVLRVPDASRTVSYDVTAGRLQMVDMMDDGRNRLADGLVYDSRILNVFSITDRQPTSASVECKRHSDETLALDLIDQIGPDGDFMGSQHTRKHFREDWYPQLFQRRNYDGWLKAGGKTLRERAQEKALGILERHQPEPLDRDVREELDRIVARANASLPSIPA